MALRTGTSSLTRELNIAQKCAVRQFATEARPKQRKTVHPPRRTYLHQQYESIVNNDRAMFIFQHNNLTVREFTALRQELSRLGAPAKLTVLRSGVFNSVLRSTKYANLEPLVEGGPTCIFHTNANDAEHPDLLKKAMAVLGKNKKMMLLGGKLDDTLLTHDDVNKIVQLPGLPQLQAELLGVLEAPGRKLLSTLDSPARQLHSILDRRIE
ncbi:hypothetical protein RO3G_09870 [Lichtheimia corymbifera JMRC:FSU:9682]|uniref:Uncharacterized protein n=1 Tax=Lichtheimia corymbifera JMRC:FSU:9682 TaxID=1263082 RepID=A0A068S2A5_9FUNG|nr:hypothetical protein RO3G_09870 [Lichtheimia corymbifera JMRC:FSU:9682]